MLFYRSWQEEEEDQEDPSSPSSPEVETRCSHSLVPWSYRFCGNQGRLSRKDCIRYECFYSDKETFGQEQFWFIGRSYKLCSTSS